MSKKKILIVEDEIKILEVVTSLMEKQGYEVYQAEDGKQALKIFYNNEISLIILDLMLPGVEGYEICKKIRETKNTPIIMVSAKKDDIDKIRGLGMGADDYMTKPFSPSELVARVKAHLSRYERLIGANRKMISLRFVVLKSTKLTDVCGLMGRRRILQQRNMNFLRFLQRTQIMYSLKKNSLARSGTWNPLEILLQLQFILKNFVKRLSLILLNHSILRQFGV